MATELERLVVTLEASTKQFENALKRVEKVNRDVLGRVERDVERSTRRQERLYGRMGDSVGKSFLRGFRQGFRLPGGGIGGILGSYLGYQTIQKAAKAGDESAKAFVQAWDQAGEQIALKLAPALIAMLKRLFPELLKDIPGRNETIIPQTRAGPGWTPGPVGARGSVPPWLVPLINQAALAYNVSPALITEIMRQETGGTFKPGLTSPKGAYGLMQLMPGTARDLGVDRYDITQNVMGGAKYLAQLQRMFPGDAASVIAAYNAGPGGAAKFSRTRRLADLPSETQAYVNNVLRNLTTHPYVRMNEGKDRERIATAEPGTEQLDAQVKAYRERNDELREWLETQDRANELEKAEQANDQQKIIQLKAEAEASKLKVDIGSKEFEQIKERIALEEQLADARDKMKQSAKDNAAELRELEQVGDVFAGAVSGFVQDIMNGVSASEALSNALKNLAAQLADMAIRQLFSGLFGGGAGGGLFGGLLGGAPAAIGAGASPLAIGRGSGAITVGGATINVAGNADTRTVAMMSKMIEVNNQRQAQQLHRNWGANGAKYRALRGP